MYVGNAEPPDTSTFRRPPRLSLCITDRYNYTDAASMLHQQGQDIADMDHHITATSSYELDTLTSHSLKLGLMVIP